MAFRRFSIKETVDFSAASEKEDVYDPADEEEPCDSSAVLVSRLVSVRLDPLGHYPYYTNKTHMQVLFDFFTPLLQNIFPLSSVPPLPSSQTVAR